MADYLFGRIDLPEEKDRVLQAKSYQYFPQLSQSIAGTGKGKRSNNVKIIKSILGRFPIIEQGTGDCVAFGLAGVINALKCLRKFQGKYADFGGFTSTEDIYGGSRILIGRGQLGRGAGSTGSWAAQYVVQYGTLLRKKYGNIDLSLYDSRRADSWGWSGVPKDLLPFAEEHQIKEYTIVKTWDDVRDSLYNGYPITVASNRGFSGRLDSKGCLLGNANWPHQMYLIDVIDDDGDPRALLVNSWPVGWVDNANREDTPHGSGWVRADILVRDMLSARDSYAFSDMEDYIPQDLTWNVFEQAKKKAENYE